MNLRNPLNLLLIAVLSFAGFALAPEIDASQALAKRAELHMASREYNAAISLLKDSLVLRPDWHDGREKLLEIYLKKRKIDSAKALLDEWSQLEPGNPKPLVELGAILETEGRLAEAVDRLQTALRLDPRNEDARNRLADLYIKQGQFDRAKNELEVLLARDDADQRTHFRLGEILAGEDANTAKAHLGRALDLGRDSPLGGQSEELLNNLIAGQNEDRAYAAATLGHAFLKHKEIVLAKREFERAVTLNPQYADPYAYIGYIWLLLRRTDLAGEYLRKAIELDPSSAFAHQIMGNVLRAEGRSVEAIVEMRKAVSMNALDPFLYSDLAMTYLAAGDLNAAEENYVKAATLARTDPIFTAQLARFYIDRMFKIGEGLEAAKRLAELLPGDSEALDLLGWALYLNGEIDQAEKTLVEAIKKEPYLASAHYHLAVLWDNSGQASRAKQSYERAAELDSSGFVERRALTALQQLATKS